MTATKLSVVAGHFYVRRHVHTEGAEENWARYVCVGIWTSVTCASSDLVTACIDGTFTNIARETTTDFTLPESPPPEVPREFPICKGETADSPRAVMGTEWIMNANLHLRSAGCYIGT